MDPARMVIEPDDELCRSYTFSLRQEDAAVINKMAAQFEGNRSQALRHILRAYSKQMENGGLRDE